MNLESAGCPELQVLSTKIFQSHEGYGKCDRTNMSHCYTRDYAMEGSPTGVQHYSRHPHPVESLQEQDV
jgi:hypothetical protein